MKLLPGAFELEQDRALSSEAIPCAPSCQEGVSLKACPSSHEDEDAFNIFTDKGLHLNSCQSLPFFSATAELITTCYQDCSSHDLSIIATRPQIPQLASALLILPLAFLAWCTHLLPCHQ